jgi:hypothetical protein
LKWTQGPYRASWLYHRVENGVGYNLKAPCTLRLKAHALLPYSRAVTTAIAAIAASVQAAQLPLCNVAPLVIVGEPVCVYVGLGTEVWPGVGSVVVPVEPDVGDGVGVAAPP